MTYRNDTADTEPTARGSVQESWHPADAVLAQDVQGRDTSSGTPAQGHQPWRGSLSRQHGCSFQPFWHCAYFHQLPPPFPSPPPQKQLTPLLLRCTPGHSERCPQSLCTAYVTGPAVQQSLCSDFRSWKGTRNTRLLWDHTGFTGLQQKKRNNPKTKNIQLLMVSNPQSKQPSADPHHSKELGVSQNVRRQNLPEVYPCFTTASERFSQAQRTGPAQAAFLSRQTVLQQREEAWQPAPLGCLLRDKRTRGQKTGAVEGFSFPTSSAGTLKQISPYTLLDKFRRKPSESRVPSKPR